MQIVVSILDSSRARQHHWVSATGNYEQCVDQLMKSAVRDMNLMASEHDEIDALVRSWTPSDGYPLPGNEDLTRLFHCDGFTLSITARSEERMAMISHEIDALMGIKE